MSEPITVGSTPIFEGLYKRDGAAWDLTGGVVTLFLRKPDGTIAMKTPTLIDPPGGVARYQALAADLDVGGRWARRWKATKGSDVFSSAWETFLVEA